MCYDVLFLCFSRNWRALASLNVFDARAIGSLVPSAMPKLTGMTTPRLPTLGRLECCYVL